MALVERNLICIISQSQSPVPHSFPALALQSLEIKLKKKSVKYISLCTFLGFFKYKYIYIQPTIHLEGKEPASDHFSLSDTNNP